MLPTENKCPLFTALSPANLRSYVSLILFGKEEVDGSSPLNSSMINPVGTEPNQ